MPPRSYRSPVRSAAARRTRARIVAAAAKLLRRRGIEEFSLESVAKSAGVTRLTVYNHFGSRRALLEAVFDDRAARGGLHRIPEAMAESDPHRALERLIAVFCEFWSFDQGAIARLHGVGSSDAEFEDAIRARNERRRRILSVLVGRMTERGDVRAQAAADLTDLLFVLSSFSVFAELSRGRSKDAACSLVQSSAEDAVNRARVFLRETW
jgi:AcrR family transcriptional regulator